MSTRTVVTVVALVATLLLAPGAQATPRDPRLQAVGDWAFALGEGSLKGDLRSRYAAYDLVVVDGEDTSAAQVTALREGGRIVLGYLSVGTIENWRSWYPQARRYRLESWEDWEGEWFADTRRRGFRDLIAKRVAPRLVGKGFDGLFLDNVAMIDDYPRQARGMRLLVASLSALVRRRGGLLFAQNGEDVMRPMLRYLDGWNREDVSRTYDFKRRRYIPTPRSEREAALAEIRRMGRAGLLVTATDYVRAGDDSATAAAVSYACGAGALPFVSDIELQRIPSEPLRCSP